MFLALVNIIQYYLQQTTILFVAPILRHCTVDGYLFNFCFIVLEFSEGYGMVTIAFLFTLFVIFYRNTTFSVYKELVSFFTNDNSYRTTLVKKLPQTLINNTRLLYNNTSSLLSTKVNRTYVAIKKFLKK